MAEKASTQPAPTEAEVKAAKAKASIYSQRALGRLLTNDGLVRAASEVDGASLNTIYAELSKHIAEHKGLNDKGETKGYHYPYLADIKAPDSDEGGEWSAIAKGADGNMHAFPFEIKDGHAEVTGEPEPVAHSNEYHFMEDDEEKKKGKRVQTTSTARVLKAEFYRYSEIEESPDGKRFPVSFASEYPAPRIARKSEEFMGAAKVGEKYLEVLSHKRGDYDFSSLNTDGAFLDEHNPKDQIGVVKRALVSKDSKSRAVVEFDEASDLSKTRKKQFEAKSRTHISVGYIHTKYLGDETLPDGRTVKRFAWAADDISSVAIPADPKVGVNRSKEGVFERSETDMAHCLRCGDPMERSELNDDFMCGDCADAKRTGVDSNHKERNNSMPNETATVTEAEVLTRTKTAAEAAATTRETDLLARNKNIHDIVEQWVKDHGKRHTKSETCESKLRQIEAEFMQRDSKTPSQTLIQELASRCSIEALKFPNIESFIMAADNDDAIARNYDLGRAIRSCIAAKGHQPTDGFELEIHQSLVRERRNTNSAVPINGDGFLIPDNARTPKIRSSLERSGTNDRFTRDLVSGNFAGAGALVPTQWKVPIIELLRNRPALTWCGVTMLGGLTGNVIIPRQTSACAPQALAEIAVLNPTQQTFDQISFAPKRVGNTAFYSRLLTIQSSPDVEALIRDDNFRQIALLIDELGFNGTGNNSQPLGIMNTPGVNSITFGGTVTLAQAIAMKTAIRQNNVNDPLAYVTTSASSGRLMSAPAALIGSTVVSGQTNAIWVGDELEGRVVGTRAFATQQIPNNQMVCGAWEHFVWASWAGIQVVIDYITRANQDEIGISLNTYNDFAARHNVAFTVSTDGANQ